MSEKSFLDSVAEELQTGLITYGDAIYKIGRHLAGRTPVGLGADPVNRLEADRKALEVVYGPMVPPGKPTPKVSIIGEVAATLDSRKGYGPIEKNFADIAKMWSVVAGAKITPEMVPLMMISMKVCRQIGSHNRDNWLDMCGFADIGNRLNEAKYKNG